MQRMKYVVYRWYAVAGLFVFAGIAGPGLWGLSSSGMFLCAAASLAAQGLGDLIEVIRRLGSGEE